MRISISYIPPTSEKEVLAKSKKFFNSKAKDKSFLSHDLLFSVYKDAVEILMFNENDSKYRYIESYINYVFQNCIIGLAISKYIQDKIVSLQNVEVYYL